MVSIFEDAFATLGRLDNISLVMGFHPQYLESFLRTQHYLLQMDGPLSLQYRHYIGIMVRDIHRCTLTRMRALTHTHTHTQCIHYGDYVSIMVKDRNRHTCRDLALSLNPHCCPLMPCTQEYAHTEYIHTHTDVTPKQTQKPQSQL